MKRSILGMAALVFAGLGTLGFASPAEARDNRGHDRDRGRGHDHRGDGRDSGHDHRGGRGDYRQSHRVWVPPVYESRHRRVWREPQYGWRGGLRIILNAGCWEDVNEQVCVREGYWN